MTKDELERCFSQLGLTQTDAARLLSVTPRTVRRWLDDEDIPGPVEQVLKAWLFLHHYNLPWGPDSAPVFEDDLAQINAARAHAITMGHIIARVEVRGGARIPWNVNLKERYAELGPMRVRFYHLRNGGFSLSSYVRKDQPPNPTRDREFIEDAAWCIGEVLKETTD